MKRITLLTLRPETLFDTLKLCSTFYRRIFVFPKNIVYLCSSKLWCSPLRKGT